MRKAMLLGVGVLGVASAAAVVVSKASAGPALDKIAPAERTIVWLEAKSPGASWEQVKAGKDWKAFEASEAYDKARERWDAVAKGGDVAMLNSLGLPLSEQTIKRFFGQDLALAVLTPADEKTRPPLVFMTKIDLLGIAKDLSVDGDWSKVWEKLSKGLSGDKGETFEDVEIRSHKWHDREIHFFMIKEVFVWSDDVGALKDVILTWKGTKPALASAAAYTSELAKLPKDEAAHVWLDMKFFRDKDRLAKAVRQAATFAPKQDQLELVDFLKKLVPEQVAGSAEVIQPILDSLKHFDPELLSVLTDDFQPMDGLALGVTFPTGDFLEASIECTRPQAQVFKDAQERELLAVLPEATFFLEGSGLYDLFMGLPTSPTVRAFARSEAVKWLKGKKPSEIQKLLTPDAMDNGTGDAAPAAPAKTYSREFEARSLTAWIELLAHQAGDDLALTVDFDQTPEPAEKPKSGEPTPPAILDHPEKAVRVLGFAKTGVLPRLALDLVSGWVVAKSKKPPLSDEYKKKFEKVAADIQTLQQSCAMFRMDAARAAVSIDELLKKPADVKTWNGPYVADEKAAKDPWGHAYVVTQKEGYSSITCLGADGAEGGDDEDKDITSENVLDLRWQLRRAPTKYEVLDVAGSKIVGVTEEGAPGIYWARFGQRWVVGNDLDAIKSVLDASRAPKPQNPLAGRLPAGQQFIVSYNFRRLWRGIGPVFERDAARSPEAARQYELQKKTFENLDATMAGISVSKDCSTVTFHAVTTLGEKGRARLLEFTHDASPELATWQVLPRDTFLSYAWNTEPKAIYDELLDLASAGKSREDIDKAMADFKEQVLAGHDLATDFLAKLGTGVGLGVIEQEKLPGQYVTDFMPQLQWVAGVMDPEIVKKAQGLQDAAKAEAKKLRDEANGADISAKLDAIRDKLQKDIRALVTDKAQLEKWDDAMKELAQGRDDLPALPAVVVALEVKDAKLKDLVLETIQAGLKKTNEAAQKQHEEWVKQLGEDKAPPVETLALVEHKAGDVTIYRLPMSGEDGAADKIGDAFGLSFAFIEGFAIAGTSENAVRKAIAAKKEGKNLSKSAAFAKLIGSQSRQVSGFTHFDWNGVVDQVEKNLPIFLRHMGATPEGLKRP
ncbi:MAG TPA: type II secretion system protein GspG, partial [Planctomycetota bacterium]|nr:type II secretion system protein GspG [Planctomycetota bacterium]